MRPAILIVSSLILLPVAFASADYGGTFQGTGWKLLRVDSSEPVEIAYRVPRGEGYWADLSAVYSETGSYLAGHPGLFADIGPGVYLDAEPAPTTVVAPNPPYTSNHNINSIYLRAGVHYVFVGVGGEVSQWSLTAPASMLVAEGPMHFAFVSDMDGGLAAEANAWMLSASVSQGRSLAFDIEETLIGIFGLPAEALTPMSRPLTYEDGNTSLTFPDGSTMECRCLYQIDDLARGPGRYVYEEERTKVTQWRMPVAVWADVPLPFD